MKAFPLSSVFVPVRRTLTEHEVRASTPTFHRLHFYLIFVCEAISQHGLGLHLGLSVGLYKYILFLKNSLFMNFILNKLIFGSR